MRNENKKPGKQADRKNISNRPLSKKNRSLSGSGLIGEHDISDTAERKIRRTPQDKNSVSGSGRDGQAE